MPHSFLRRRAAFIVLACAATLPALTVAARAAPPEDAPNAAYRDPARDERLQPKSHETTGSVQIGGQKVDYRAVAGLLVVEDSKDEASATMSYVAYFKRGREDEDLGYAPFPDGVPDPQSPGGSDPDDPWDLPIDDLPLAKPRMVEIWRDGEMLGQTNRQEAIDRARDAGYEIRG
jgi:hypothetical protein